LPGCSRLPPYESKKGKWNAGKIGGDKKRDNAPIWRDLWRKEGNAKAKTGRWRRDRVPLVIGRGGMDVPVVGGDSNRERGQRHGPGLIQKTTKLYKGGDELCTRHTKGKLGYIFVLRRMTKGEG